MHVLYCSEFCPRIGPFFFFKKDQIDMFVKIMPKLESLNHIGIHVIKTIVVDYDFKFF